jgi:two-component system, chemotaxis family, chemotaxis protein CheY
VARIFVIGNNLLIRTLLREILGDAGHQVDDAEDSREVVDRVLHFRAELVILDIVLVRREGLSRTQSLRTLDPAPEVIICAALLERRNAIAALQAGARAFIVKPFNRQTVLESIDAASRHVRVAEPAQAFPAATAAPDGAPRGVEEHRDFMRLKAALPVTLTPTGGRSIETHTNDISGGGMLLESAALPVDAIVAFVLELAPDVDPVTGDARVVRITADGMAALQFEHVAIAEHERLTAYIAERATRVRSAFDQ